MKFTLTGSLGQITTILAGELIQKGHDVTIISSNPDKKEAIIALGAKPAIGSITDLGFLIHSFLGADAVYTMVPPNYKVADYRQYSANMGATYALAIKAADVKRVVNLSSVGAHLESGTGPISGLYDVEHQLDTLDQVAVRHLRAGYFYTNFYSYIGQIKSMNVMGSNYGEDVTMLMAHPADIARFAARALEEPFTGHSVQYVISDEQKIGDIAKVLGASIGKPELPWIQFRDEDVYNGLIQAGMSPSAATDYVEMGDTIRNGGLWEDYAQNKPKTFGSIKLTDFAHDFANAYGGSVQ